MQEQMLRLGLITILLIGVLIQLPICLQVEYTKLSDVAGLGLFVLIEGALLLSLLLLTIVLKLLSVPLKRLGLRTRLILLLSLLLSSRTLILGLALPLLVMMVGLAILRSGLN